MAKSMDPKLVASKEDHEREVKTIASKYKVPVKDVRTAMKIAGKDGKPGRSRAKIYDALRVMDHPIPYYNKKKKAVKKAKKK